MKSHNEGMLKAGEAAMRAGVDRNTVRAAAARGLIKFEITPGGHWLFDEVDIDAYAESLKQRVEARMARVLSKAG
jgi:excisionase family DNA binding protein